MTVPVPGPGDRFANSLLGLIPKSGVIDAWRRIHHHYFPPARPVDDHMGSPRKRLLLRYRRPSGRRRRPRGHPNQTRPRGTFRHTPQPYWLLGILLPSFWRLHFTFSLRPLRQKPTFPGGGSLVHPLELLGSPLPGRLLRCRPPRLRPQNLRIMIRQLYSTPGH